MSVRILIALEYTSGYLHSTYIPTTLHYQSRGNEMMMLEAMTPQDLSSKAVRMATRSSVWREMQTEALVEGECMLRLVGRSL